MLSWGVWNGYSGPALSRIVRIGTWSRLPSRSILTIVLVFDGDDSGVCRLIAAESVRLRSSSIGPVEADPFEGWGQFTLTTRAIFWLRVAGDAEVGQLRWRNL